MMPNDGISSSSRVDRCKKVHRTGTRKSMRLQEQNMQEETEHPVAARINTTQNKRKRYTKDQIRQMVLDKTLFFEKCVQVEGTCQGRGESKRKQEDNSKRKKKSQKRTTKFNMPEGKNKRIFKGMTRIRSGPRNLAAAVRCLTPCQKKWVKDMGFKDILRFSINSMPHRLAYFLVNKFNESTATLELECGDISITENHVETVFGFPRGRHRIDNFEGKNSDHIKCDWQNQFPPGKKISAAMVLDKIKKERSVTKLFKYNFFIILYNALIRPNSNPSIKEDFLNFPGDINRLFEYNWCDLVVRTLISEKKRWKKNKAEGFFTGPLLFLVLLYVDRVLNGERDVTRLFPTFLSWDDASLKNRERRDKEHGGFGTGTLSEESVILSSREAQTCSGPQSRNSILKKKLQKRLAKIEKTKKEFKDTFAKWKSLNPTDDDVREIEASAISILTYRNGTTDASNPNEAERENDELDQLYEEDEMNDEEMDEMHETDETDDEYDSLDD